MLNNIGIKMKWLEEVSEQSWSLWDGFCRARVKKLSNGWWIGEVFSADPCCVGSHTLTLDNAKTACERVWSQIKEHVRHEEACPKAYDIEVEGDHPRVYCTRGCGCWTYASPSPTHACGGLCSQHPPIDCKTFQCMSSDCFEAFILDHQIKSLAAETKRCESCGIEYPTANMTKIERCNDFWRCAKCVEALITMLDKLDGREES